MYTIYNFVSGPMVWAAFTIFAGGILYRIAALIIRSCLTDRVVIEYFSLRYAIRSIFHWMIPLGTRSMQQQPVVTCVSFVFHVMVLAVPVFLLAHIVLIKESLNIAWWHIPDAVADVMTMLVILSCIFFFLRRILLPEIYYLTSASDFIMLILVAAPFVTGFWASQQWIGYRFAFIAHMLTGEILLAAVPFTRLSHMFYFPFTRAYMGSEFGAVRHARDW